MKPHGTASDLAAAIGWVLLLCAGVATLLWLGGDPRLALPPWEDMATVAIWRRWFAARESVDVLVAFGRIGLLVVGGWLVLLMGVALVTRIAGWVRPVAVVERLTPPIARGLINSALGIGVAVATLSPPAAARASATSAATTTAAAAETDRDDVPLLRRLPAPATPVTGDPPVDPPDDRPPPSAPAVAPSPSPAAPSPAAPRFAPVPAPGSPAVADRGPGQQHDTAPASPAAGTQSRRAAPVAGTAPAGPTTWTVTAGDHFWSIAESVVGRTESAPSVRDVRRYWRQLIRVNRDRLVDPSNPDYILPGQQLHLPPTDG